MTWWHCDSTGHWSMSAADKILDNWNEHHYHRSAPFHFIYTWSLGASYVICQYNTTTYEFIIAVYNYVAIMSRVYTTRATGPATTSGCTLSSSDKRSTRRIHRPPWSDLTDRQCLEGDVQWDSECPVLTNAREMPSDLHTARTHGRTVLIWFCRYLSI